MVSIPHTGYQDPSLFNLFSSLTDPVLSNTEGDIYIRSVRFSPDGQYLAAGAEDMKVRVRTFPHPYATAIVEQSGIDMEHQTANVM